MQKDVIYIDTEDDITAIIGKVKGAKAKIVALVPPKRIGAIQSAVNLKLVHRAAENVDKRLVLISNNAALMALAGSAGIPVAKNLQSKPELAEIPALEIDDGEDVIDGDAIQAGKAAEDTGEQAAAIPAAGAVAATSAAATKSPVAALGAAATAAKSKAKIPDFNKFRKKFVLIGLGAVLLIGGLIWALVFAPRAEIVVTARTSDVALNTQVKLVENAATGLNEGVIKMVTKTSKKEVSLPFTASGKKDVGEKAKGTVRFSTNNIDNLGTTIPAGTVLTSSSGPRFATDTSVTMTISNYRGVNTTVTAVDRGGASNGANGNVTGAPSGIAASLTGATAGGTDKTVTVVEQADVDDITDDITSSEEEAAAKKALQQQLGSEYVVLESSFKIDSSAVKPNPAVGAESPDGKGVLAGSVTYSIAAVAKSELDIFLNEYFAQTIDGKSNQKVYNNGKKSVSFTNVNGAEGGFTANITTNGKIGPKIDENALKEFAKGKKTGEIQDYAQNINGVESVEVKLSPFWVMSVPNDAKKITVEFKVND